MKCDHCLAVAGGVPVGRLEHVPLDRLHKGTPPVTETADKTIDESPAAEADDENDVEAQLRRERNLPDDVPLAIEVDLGHTHGWAEAEVTKVRGRWLHYTLREEHASKTDRHGGRVQVIGCDIIWHQSAKLCA